MKDAISGMNYAFQFMNEGCCLIILMVVDSVLLSIMIKQAMSSIIITKFNADVARERAEAVIREKV